MDNCIYEIFFKDGSSIKIHGDYNISDGVFRFFEARNECGIEKRYIFPINSILYIVGVNK